MLAGGSSPSSLSRGLPFGSFGRPGSRPGRIIGAESLGPSASEFVPALLHAITLVILPFHLFLKQLQELRIKGGQKRSPAGVARIFPRAFPGPRQQKVAAPVPDVALLAAGELDVVGDPPGHARRIARGHEVAHVDLGHGSTSHEQADAALLQGQVEIARSARFGRESKEPAGRMSPLPAKQGGCGQGDETVGNPLLAKDGGQGGRHLPVVSAAELGSGRAEGPRDVFPLLLRGVARQGLLLGFVKGEAITELTIHHVPDDVLLVYDIEDEAPALRIAPGHPLPENNLTPADRDRWCPLENHEAEKAVAARQIVGHRHPLIVPHILAELLDDFRVGRRLGHFHGQNVAPQFSLGDAQAERLILEVGVKGPLAPLAL